MKPVVIEMQNGKPVVVSCPKKVTAVYRVKAFLGAQ
jgi:hypothetical protein